MSNNGWKEDPDLTPKERKEHAEHDKRDNLHRFRDKQTGFVQPESQGREPRLGDNSVPSYEDLLRQRAENERAAGNDRILFGTVPKGLFDPPDRPLTDAEKAHPLTFFGVTYEMRAERLKPGNRADQFRQEAAERPATKKERGEQERDR